MTPPKILLTFIDRPGNWPTAVRADLFARYQRSVGQPIRHWIINRDGGLSATDCARLGIRTAGVRSYDAYIDSAQVMADRLQMTGRAYDAEGRVYLPWGGDRSYAPPTRREGRCAPSDVRLWGPHWAGGPVGPSATLIQWAAIHEHAHGSADWLFGHDAQTGLRLHAVAQALTGQAAAATVRPALHASGSHTAHPRAWDGPSARWAALQCRSALSPAQSRYGVRMSRAARLARIPGDAPPNPAHLRLVEHAEQAIARFEWPDANGWLLGLCKTITRMQTGHANTRYAPSRETRVQMLALIDALGL